MDFTFVLCPGVSHFLVNSKDSHDRQKEFRDAYPTELVWRLLAKGNPLQNPGDWTKPEYESLDISMYQALKGLGLNDASIELAFNQNVGYGNSAYDISALEYYFINAWASMQRKIAPTCHVIKQGNQRLPMAMAESSNTEVQLNKEVVSIESDATGVTVMIGSAPATGHISGQVLCIQTCHFWGNPRTEFISAASIQIPSIVAWRPRWSRQSGW